MTSAAPKRLFFLPTAVAATHTLQALTCPDQDCSRTFHKSVALRRHLATGHCVGRARVNEHIRTSSLRKRATCTRHLPPRVKTVRRQDEARRNKLVYGKADPFKKNSVNNNDNEDIIVLSSDEDSSSNVVAAPVATPAPVREANRYGLRDCEVLSEYDSDKENDAGSEEEPEILEESSTPANTTEENNASLMHTTQIAEVEPLLLDVVEEGQQQQKDEEEEDAIRPSGSMLRKAKKKRKAVALDSDSEGSLAVLENEIAELASDVSVELNTSSLIRPFSSIRRNAECGLMDEAAAFIPLPQPKRWSKWMRRFTRELRRIDENDVVSEDSEGEEEIVPEEEEEEEMPNQCLGGDQRSGSKPAGTGGSGCQVPSSSSYGSYRTSAKQSGGDGRFSRLGMSSRGTSGADSSSDSDDERKGKRDPKLSDTVRSSSESSDEEDSEKSNGEKKKKGVKVYKNAGTWQDFSYTGIKGGASSRAKPGPAARRTLADIFCNLNLDHSVAAAVPDDFISLDELSAAMDNIVVNNGSGTANVEDPTSDWTDNEGTTPKRHRSGNEETQRQQQPTKKTKSNDGEAADPYANPVASTSTADDPPPTQQPTNGGSGSLKRGANEEQEEGATADVGGKKAKVSSPSKSATPPVKATKRSRKKSTSVLPSPMSNSPSPVQHKRSRVGDSPSAPSKSPNSSFVSSPLSISRQALTSALSSVVAPPDDDVIDLCSDNEDEAIGASQDQEFVPDFVAVAEVDESAAESILPDSGTEDNSPVAMMRRRRGRKQEKEPASSPVYVEEAVVEEASSSSPAASTEVRRRRSARRSQQGRRVVQVEEDDEEEDCIVLD